MRIFITAHSSRYGGGVTVAKNLIAAFGRVAPQHEFFFTIPPGLGYEECCRMATRHEKVIYTQQSLPERWLWETYKLPTILRDFRADVVFNIANRGIVDIAIPQAILIQDSHLFYPASQYGRTPLIERMKYCYHRKHFIKTLKSTQLIFCQTEVAATRIKSSYGIHTRIAICPNQVSSLAYGDSKIVPKPLRRIEAKTKLFVLSRYYSHKNLEIIPELFRKYSDKLNDVAFILTISPDQHPNAARLLKLIEKKSLAKHIISIGAIPQSELGGYYGNTDALFLPTLMESYSGTYLEAMHFRKPILTSDMDFARAVCGDAALYFDPKNVEDIQSRILEFKENKGLEEMLAENGQRRYREALSTSWDEISRAVIQELESLVTGHL